MVAQGSMLSKWKFDLPALRSNPFSLAPLEPESRDLLVGRGVEVERFYESVHYSSARQILLIGESGSGRTSLLSAVAGMVDAPKRFTMLPEDGDLDRCLGELYCTLVSFDSPQGGRSSIVEHIVASLAPSPNGEIPLIILDDSSIDGGILAELTMRLLPLFRRMKAVVVISVTPAQIASWSDDLVESFDLIGPLNPLAEEEVKDLICSRMNRAGAHGWVPPQGLVEEILDQTGGHPRRIVRLMRDAIDHQRTGRDRTSALAELHLRMQSQLENSSSLDELESSPSPPVHSLSPLPIPVSNVQTPEPIHTQTFQEAPGVEWSASPEILGHSPSPPGFGGLAARNRNFLDASNEFPSPSDQPVTPLPLAPDPRIDQISPEPEPSLLIDDLKGMEVTLLIAAAGRSISPSDEKLQLDFGIGRPRLSQILNGLRKRGYLNVEMQGRHRMFRTPVSIHTSLIHAGHLEEVEST